ncbi:unnamed protein product [Dovyalis caffra]|uniref:Uncharacterized protein n=1 Tax=Dovyalis caffra TaxID=77055 RepID=A0AAV1ST44_9ROSI|nr:unnamed protein product [Dovyalis caffra]
MSDFRGIQNGFSSKKRVKESFRLSVSYFYVGMIEGEKAMKANKKVHFRLEEYGPSVKDGFMGEASLQSSGLSVKDGFVGVAGLQSSGLSVKDGVLDVMGLDGELIKRNGRFFKGKRSDRRWQLVDKKKVTVQRYRWICDLAREIKKEKKLAVLHKKKRDAHTLAVKLGTFLESEDMFEVLDHLYLPVFEGSRLPIISEMESDLNRSWIWCFPTLDPTLKNPTSDLSSTFRCFRPALNTAVYKETAGKYPTFKDMNSSTLGTTVGQLERGLAGNHILGTNSWKEARPKRKRSGKIKSSMKRLKAEMAEIGEQQKRVKKGQMEIREKFKEIELDCDQLKKETFLISEQAGRNQQRLSLMFKIVKARENNNFSEADKLTQSLRLVLPLSSCVRRMPDEAQHGKQYVTICRFKRLSMQPLSISIIDQVSVDIDEREKNGVKPLFVEVFMELCPTSCSSEALER